MAEQFFRQSHDTVQLSALVMNVH